MNDRGEVAFFSEMTGGSADFGVFRGDGGDLTPLFVANQIAPGGATFADFGNPVINSHGQVAVLASLTNSASRIGLFAGDGTDAVAIALEGQPAPKGGNYGGGVGGTVFQGPIRLNDRGEVAFNSALTSGTSTSGIFRGNGERTNDRRARRDDRAGNDRNVQVVRRLQAQDRRPGRLHCHVSPWRGRRERLQ
jgi:hypothetical protein